MSELKAKIEKWAKESASAHWNCGRMEAIALLWPVIDAAQCVDAQFKIHGASLDKLKQALAELERAL